MPLTVDAAVPYVASAEITVDGIRDEPVWATATQIPSPLVTFQPDFGHEPTGATEVWITSDKKALYVAAHMADPEVGKLRHAIGRRDTRWSDDFFALYLDPSGDAQRAYLFLVSAGGVLHDGTATASGEDASWDAAWQGAAHIGEDGWSVEMAIPWHAVRHPEDVSQLGLFVFRHIGRLGEKSSWPALDPAVQGLLVQEAVLRGPGRLPPDPGLDLLPELTFGWTDEGPATGPFTFAGLSAGLTTRFVPVPSVSLLGTFNPDFSQVESDASQISVNRRNALYFQEKRPFFLDGQEWFSFPLGELVYTRTVVAPYGGMRATFEPPGATIAALWAVDAEPGPTVSEEGGWTEEDIDGHDASVAVVRLRKPVGSDGHVGLLLSDRTILGTSLANRVAGADARVRLSDITTLTGSVAGAVTSFGDGHTAVAPAANAEISASAEHTYAGAWGNVVAPEFRAENGFFVGVDRIATGAWAGGTAHPDSSVLPRLNFTPVSVWYGVTFDGQPRSLGAEVNADGLFGNGVYFGGGASIGGERYADTWLPTQNGWLWANGPLAEWLEFDANVSGGKSPYYDPVKPFVGDSLSLSGGATLRPIPRLAIGADAAYERFEDDGTALYAGFVGRGRVELNVSRTLSGRVVADVDTFGGNRQGEVLLAWERSPGTGVYVGGSGALATAFEPEHWTVFAKVSTAISPHAGSRPRDGLTVAEDDPRRPGPHLPPRTGPRRGQGRTPPLRSPTPR